MFFISTEIVNKILYYTILIVPSFLRFCRNCQAAMATEHERFNKGSKRYSEFDEGIAEGKTVVT